MCPVCLGLPGIAAGAERAGRRVRAAARRGARLRRAGAVDLRPEELLLSRHAEGLPGQPVRGPDPRRRAARGRRRAWSGSSARTSRRTPARPMHVGGGGRIHEADHSLVDYNRAGVPLMEIVSRPDIRTAEQAACLRRPSCAPCCERIGVSDVKMEEGSMRVDANVSVRRRGASELGTKVEIKNMNSLRSLGRAIDYEIERQIETLEHRRADRAGDPPLGRSRRPHARHAHQGGVERLPLLPRARPRAGRADRRAMRAAAAAALPELPAARRARLVADWGIGEADARRAGRRRPASPTTPKRRSRRCTGGTAARRRELVHRRRARRTSTRAGLSPEVLPLAPDGLAELVGLVADGHAVAQPGQGRARRVPARAEAAEAGRRRSAASRR